MCFRECLHYYYALHAGSMQPIDPASRHPATSEAIAVRRHTVEHVFGIIKGWLRATHFRTRGLKHVSTENNLEILACNMKRAIAVAVVAATLEAATESREQLVLLQAALCPAIGRGAVSSMISSSDQICANSAW
jgi:hypothetical protein